MVWVFPEYGGQVAVRIGDHMILRRKLKSPKPGSWEVYDVVQDPTESRNLAAERGDLIEQAVVILQRETAPNPLFPMEVPAVE